MSCDIYLAAAFSNKFAGLCRLLGGKKPPRAWATLYQACRVCVPGVLRAGAPFQIRGQVVPLVAVKMIDIGANERVRIDEPRCCYKPVNRHGFSASPIVKNDYQVLARAHPWRKPLPLSHSSPILFWVRPDAPIARHRVEAFVSRNWAQFVSHGASKKEAGRARCLRTLGKSAGVRE